MALTYSTKFYEEMKDTNLSSAYVITPLIIDLIQPKSVVDVGCGTGIWLKAFLEKGITNIVGIDGEWVKEDMLVIPKESFKIQNFEEPFTIKHSADLAVCLEVGEHVSNEAAHALVSNLTGIAPVILFSAAIPFQGGSRHINEQWPEYWEKKFQEKGFVPVDCIRRKVWDDKRVSFFYAQNILVYVKKDALSSYPKLHHEREMGHDKALPMVHPHMYLYYAERWRMVVPFLGKFPPGMLHAGKRFIQFLRRK
jgi:SAM-dependent methyltransferase